MKIIQITTKTLPWLGEVCAQWLKESKSVIPMDVEAAQKHLSYWAGSNNNRIFGLVEEIPGMHQIVGFLVGEKHVHAMTGQDIVTELAWYVMPEYRGEGKRLLTALEEWGKELGVPAASCHVMLSASTDKGERAVNALKKLGYKEFGRTFYKLI